MRSSTPQDLIGRCKACLLPIEACLCGAIEKVETQTRFLILRHVKEAWKTSNTARLAALAIPGATVRAYGQPHDPVPAPGEGVTWLLFPGARAHVPPGRPDLIVVLDGTWAQARRMTQRIAWLKGMPRLSLLPVAAHDGLRREPDAASMPTVIAISRAVALLEGEGKAQKLERLHGELVRRVRSLRGVE